MNPVAKIHQISDQIAALPVRWTKKGKLRVLMVTSRGSGRWLMPKGWIMNGKKPWTAAAIEALEEAGAIGFVSPVPVGSYKYRKDQGRGGSMICKVVVYPMIVSKLKNNWKERDERKRRWFTPKKAARVVSEPKLAKLLKRLAADPGKVNDLEDLLKAS